MVRVDGPYDGPKGVPDPVARADLPVIVRLQLRLPQPIEHIDKGQQQLGEIACIHNGLTPCFGLGPDFLFEHLPSLQDLLITKGEQGDVLNEGLVAEAMQAVFHTMHQRAWACTNIHLKLTDRANGALYDQRAGPVFIPVHGVLEGLLVVKCVNTIRICYKQYKF